MRVCPGQPYPTGQQERRGDRRDDVGPSHLRQEDTERQHGSWQQKRESPSGEEGIETYPGSGDEAVRRGSEKSESATGEHTAGDQHEENAIRDELHASQSIFFAGCVTSPCMFGRMTGHAYTRARAQAHTPAALLDEAA